MQKNIMCCILVFPYFFMLPVLAIEDCTNTIPIELRQDINNEIYSCTAYEKEFNDIVNNDPKFEQLFKLHVAKFSNLDGTLVKFKKSEKYIYRSAILSENIALLSELVKNRGVRSILALTNSKLFNIVPWLDKEKSVFSVLGGSQFIHTLDFDDRLSPKDNTEMQNMQKRVAAIIKIIANTEGNVLIHCLGGEHKTELIFEVMRKCINGIDMEDIAKSYKCHTGWKNDKIKGGFKPANIEFIQNYPCDLLENI